MKNISFKSLTTNKLKKIDILSICKIKNSYWKYGIKSHLNWFKKNIKKNDIHNLFFFKKTLVGYNLLRRRFYFLNNIKKKYLYFDTLIVSKKHRKLNLGRDLCYFNTKIITKLKLHSFLLCNTDAVKFYKKSGWVKLSKLNFNILDHSVLKIYSGMVFNQSRVLIKNKRKYLIF